MKDDINTIAQSLDEGAVTYVALDDPDIAVRLRPVDVGAAPAREVVEHEDLVDVLLDERIGNV